MENVDNRSEFIKGENKFYNVEAVNKTEVRWWMAEGAHTDETICTELYAMHNADFGGVELCQLADKNLDASIYGYGGSQWEHDVRLILNTAMELGMTVSITSGAGWKAGNVPGLDPDSQAANQCIVLLTEELSAGQKRVGMLPNSDILRPKHSFLGAYAFKKTETDGVYEDGAYLELTSLIANGALCWTAPLDGNYTVMYYFCQGTADRVDPSVLPSYTVNLLDRRGVDALTRYLSVNVLNDEGINEKIKSGNVQLFMDSLEYRNGKGITLWSDDFADEFKKRKGYDVLPFMFVAKGAPSTSIWTWSNNAELIGNYRLTNIELNKKILNDIYDVQTKLYIENFLTPLRVWLNSYGIKLRTQISYGKCLEISEPISAVDYPEAENRNQKNQLDMYRLWSGGAHLQNKILSSETGGINNSAYSYTYQRHLQEAYTLYASGYSRIIWHVWSSCYGPMVSWPGYEGGNGMGIYYKFGLREPSYDGYSEFNEHLGRIQKLLREGRSGVDLGIIYTKYGQHMAYTDRKDWLHTHEPMFFPSTVLQDSGFTYDYLSPELLKADGVYFDKDNKTLELAGYRALVLWQDAISADGAKTVLNYASVGLPVVIVEGAASKNIYNDGRDGELFETVRKLRELKNVSVVKSAEDVKGALEEQGIDPYVKFSVPNQQLLTHTRRDGKNRYLYVYNYCDGSLHNDTNTEHGGSISTSVIADGSFKPYRIDSWTGKTEPVSYRCTDGKTAFDIALDYGDIALYALEATTEERYEAPEYIAFQSYDITDWSLRVEAWTPSDKRLERKETLYGVTTGEYAIETQKTNIDVKLRDLVTWDKIEAVGRGVSGKGYYSASFKYDVDADRVIIDFGRLTQCIRVYVNGKKTANINMNIPRVDITELLQVGENTVEIEYSSNLNNVQLSRGAIKEGVSQSDFVGYDTAYQNYGISLARLIYYKKT